MRILPGFLKELSKHIPAVLFETVEWSELASEIPKISRRIIQKDGYEELFNSYKNQLLVEKICVREMLSGDLELSHAMGERILTLYFAQVYSDQGVFLDLRSSHFASDDQFLEWHPNGLWVKFDPSFLKGLREVYEGFYLENEELYYKGLLEIGLLREDFSIDDKKILADIFKKQFGNSLHEDIKFEMDHLNQSMIKMSEFMLNKKLKISKDFLYLGIYLVTMYSTLEKINAKLPVKAIYLKSRDRFFTSVKS